MDKLKRQPYKIYNIVSPMLYNNIIIMNLAFESKNLRRRTATIQPTTARLFYILVRFVIQVYNIIL